MYVSRIIEKQLISTIANNPVTGIIGPRQCGKSTLAKKILEQYKNVIYLDLERPSDLQKLTDAEWFFSSNNDSLFCIDEIQRKPDLFPLIRSLVDEWNMNGKFLILGSANRDLLRQSSESLAGRISYMRLSPFLWKELNESDKIEAYITKGGFPKSFLKDNTDLSFKWREDFISSFLERDLLQWSVFSTATMRRLWQMLAHVNGQTVNYSILGKSLGVSNVTVRNYIDLLQGTFMLDVVPPYISNLGKRLVKSPKVYISDSGITAALIQLQSFEQLMGSPVIGSLWEQIVLTNLKGHFPSAQYYFYRTSAGAEMDFVMQYKNKIYAIECKSGVSPSLTKGAFNAIDDIKPFHTFIVAPVKTGWPMKKNIQVVSLRELIFNIK
ncbi:MAG: ATP-binding protein [Bacteroidales bacterium]|nr:ATP-binding protein [Bacteroidales bacterium]